MRPHNHRDGNPRLGKPRRPVVEGLEARELLSAVSTVTNAKAHSRPRPVAAAVQALANQARPDSHNGLDGIRASARVLDMAVINQAAGHLYPPGSPTGSPTPREIRRQTFAARWVGTYTIGPPRFSDRASTIHIYGVSGGSNQFLKGKFQIALFPPADPSATPTPGNPFANQTTGVAGLITQNYLQSGGLLVLDLNAPATAGASPGQLPTHLTWTYDNNASAGPYSAPSGIVPGSGFTEGTGTLDLQYVPSVHPEAGTMGSGTVIVTFHGLINTSQIVSAVSKAIS
jgi:hypothetical protein